MICGCDVYSIMGREYIVIRMEVVVTSVRVCLANGKCHHCGHDGDVYPLTSVTSERAFA